MAIQVLEQDQNFLYTMEALEMQLNELSFGWNYLTYEEIQKKIIYLNSQLESVEHPLLQKVQKKMRKKLDQLSFRYLFPIVEEMQRLPSALKQEIAQLFRIAYLFLRSFKMGMRALKKKPDLMRQIFMDQEDPMAYATALCEVAERKIFNEI